MIARTFSAFQFGIEGHVLQVEAAPQAAPPQIHITGLPTEVIRESRERIRVALGQLGFDVPSQKVVVHLSPANRKKEGSQFDLPVALAVLGAEGCLSSEKLLETAFLGELGLGGSLKRVRNIIPLFRALVNAGSIRSIVVPKANAPEALLLKRDKIYVADQLGEVVEWLNGRRELERPAGQLEIAERIEGVSVDEAGRGVSIDEVLGHSLAKRVLLIALAGRHHLLFIGQPGVGKTMLSQSAARLLPPLSDDELLELAAIQTSVMDEWKPSRARPFRSPHHSISLQGFVGGGSGRVVPGEISLAHRGVLFLDELPEFRRDVIESLREPLQSSEVSLTRVGHTHRFPADVLLITAMNPCPCGLMFNREKRCRCPRERILSYRKKISGAILDRIDLGLVLTSPTLDKKDGTLTEREFKERVRTVWCRQAQRKEKALIIPEWLRERSTFASVRGLKKIARVAQTIADLEDSDSILEKHYEEAWALRCPDIHALQI